MSSSTDAGQRPQEPGALLSAASRALLLALARRSVAAAAANLALPTLSADAPAELTAARRGAFVTLKHHRRLRGCIGLLESTYPLAETIIRMAAAAAVEDPRFRPVKPAEVGSLAIEISVLSPLRLVASACEIVMGRDGVLVECRGRTGVFLPQVASETGWDRERFLAELCSGKACLDPDAWKSPEARLYTFTAEILLE